MGLIDLKTDLKSLRYGKDTLGGGYSGQPYIQTSIPDSFNDLGAREDFILRGGIGAVRDSLTDIKRLGKMFIDTKSPNGLLFIAKQQLLSRTAVRTQTSGILNEFAYSPLNTLAQAGLVAFGGHLKKQGINPFASTGAYADNTDALYDWKVNPFRNNAAFNPDTNRLVNLYDLTDNSRNGTKKDGTTLNNGINVMTYTGGPGSDLGVGNTGIRYQNEKNRTFLTKPTKNFSFGNNTWVYNSTLTSGSVSNKNTFSPKIQDFREILRKNLQGQDKQTATFSGATTLSQDYNYQGGVNFTQRVNIGDPGQRGAKNYGNYTNGVSYGNISTVMGPYSTGLDKINSLPIYRSQNALVDKNVTNDFVKFRIAIIDNDAPNFKTFMNFRAFLGPISDSYNAQWNSFQYLGRGENFYTYGGFTRTISLSWTVAAQSKQELIPMYKKLNYLASSLAPDYSPDGYMRGNLVQLTIGGYLYEQPGFITGLTYEMGEESPWEIGIGVVNGSEDGTVKELTQIIKVTGFNFTPIQKFIPRLQDNSFGSDAIGFAETYGPERFIALANGIGKEDNNYNVVNTNTKPPTVTPSGVPTNDEILQQEALNPTVLP
jgi:hypothetical protein